MDPMFAVCWKVLELGCEVDPLTGEARPDPVSLGVSPADEAALEWALRCAELYGGRVRLVSVGGQQTEAVLRQGAAAGATEIVRVSAPEGLASDLVARELAVHLAGAELVWCGDVSMDRGSGSVPAYLAAHLGVAQALGLVGVELVDQAVASGSDIEPCSARLEVLRRLDGGRRERLVVERPAVVSCEGSTARLRRASLGALLSAREATVSVHEAQIDPGLVPEARLHLVSVGPYRPRARVVAPPSGSSAAERIQSLTGITRESRTARTLSAAPAQAAEAILEALEGWGEVG
ncbi:MAG: mycofactocin-associated electron transfer flavoprotein beta subunit [Acidimicrobiales bacterium]